MDNIALVGRVYDRNKVESYIISVGSIMARLSKADLLEFLDTSSICGVTRNIKGTVYVSKEINTFRLSLETATSIKYTSYSELCNITSILESSSNKSIKDIKIHERIELLNRIRLETKTIEGEKVVYLCRLMESNRYILLNKASIIKLVRTKTIRNATVANQLGKKVVYTEVNSVSINTLKLQDKTVYNMVGNVLRNNLRYYITGLVHDYFNRIHSITVKDSLTEESNTYGSQEYIKLSKFKHDSQRKDVKLNEDTEIIKYPCTLANRDKTSILNLSYQDSVSILGNNNVTQVRQLMESDIDIEKLSDCIGILENVSECVAEINSDNSIEKLISDGDNVEAIGLCVTTTQGALVSYRSYSKSYIALKVNDNYTLVSYGAFTRSVIQKINNIDIETLPRYDIGLSKNRSGYREYNMEKGMTKFFM